MKALNAADAIEPFDTPHGLNHWEWIIIRRDCTAAGRHLPTYTPQPAPASTKIQLLLLKSGIK